MQLRAGAYFLLGFLVVACATPSKDWWGDDREAPPPQHLSHDDEVRDRAEQIYGGSNKARQEQATKEAEHDYFWAHAGEPTIYP